MLRADSKRTDVVRTNSFQVRQIHVGIVLFSLGRTGENVVGAEIGIAVAAEVVGMFGAEVAPDAAQCGVHDGEAAGEGWERAATGLPSLALGNCASH